MWHVFAAAMLLTGCSAAVQVPPQPTAASVQTANADLAQLSTDPTATFHTGVQVVRAACQVYLNQEASQAAKADQVGVGVGALGGGLSLVNPLAGTAAALFQAFLTSYQQAGAMPYGDSTSSQILAEMDAYEQAAPAPPDNATAMSLVDDMWFLCTPAGYRGFATAAISTASISAAPAQSPGTRALSRGLATPTRPVITVNGR